MFRLGVQQSQQVLPEKHLLRSNPSTQQLERNRYDHMAVHGAGLKS